MAIVKGYSKKNNTTYLYEQDMKWNPVTGRPEGTRKLVGKLDAQGNMVPTGKRGRPRKSHADQDTNTENVDDRILKLQEQLDAIGRQNQKLFAENLRQKELIRDYEKKIGSITKLIQSWNSE